MKITSGSRLFQLRIVKLQVRFVVMKVRKAWVRVLVLPVHPSRRLEGEKDRKGHNMQSPQIQKKTTNPPRRKRESNGERERTTNMQMYPTTKNVQNQGIAAENASDTAVVVVVVVKRAKKTENRNTRPSPKK